ncbi:MAG: beta-propeller domain-containing protein [Deltaproteobacteria bacterium]|nr:beta-propeller domain-containing protein [Deltaproteobacteria bacterium]
MFRSILSTSLALALLLPTAACNGQQDDPVPSGEVGLERFSDCGGLRAYAADVMLETVLQWRYGYYGWYALESDADAPTNDSQGGADEPTDYTTTNVQEEGVDEIDIVKSDGTYLYIAQDQALHIVDSWPAEEAHEVSTLELDGWVRGLFLNGDQLVIFSWNYDEALFEGRGSTRVQVVDVTDRAHPVITRTIDMEGYLADGRMVDGDVYAVLNHWLSMPEEVYNLVWDEDLGLPEVDYNLQGEAYEAARQAAMDEAREILRPLITAAVFDMDLDAFLPEWKDQVEGAAPSASEAMHHCSDVYRPGDLAQWNMLSVVHLDLDEGGLDATGVLSDGWTLYASQDNLYVAQSSWWWWWGWGDMDMQTKIHKFKLNPETEPEYVASGAVDGWLYDQFAMSEYEGHLRVTTTLFDWWWGTGSEGDQGNNLFVLEDDGLGSMDVVGSVTGLAPGEQIYANRMLGDKGYMVTFRQTDPLWTFDLSDPYNPRQVGELVMPGYSAYLHPIDEGHLLAIGMDGDESGNLRGVSVNVFDVSDLANPQLTHQEVIGGDNWSWSEAMWDHHAFTFHRDVLSIPAYTYVDNQDGSWDYFSGIYAFSVDVDAGVALLGTVDHRDLVEESECLYNRWYDYYEEEVCDDWAWYAQVRRAAYVEDNLFSISDYGVKVNDLNDPSIEHTRVVFYPAE